MAVTPPALAERFVERLRAALIDVHLPRDDRMTAVLQSVKKVRRTLSDQGASQDLQDQIFLTGFMCGLLRLRKGEHVVQLGVGSGCASAILARLVQSLTVVETDAVLAQASLAGIDYPELRNLRIAQTIPETFAAAIFVTEAAAEWPHEALSLLRIGGRAVIRLGAPNTPPRLFLATKRRDGTMRIRSYDDPVSPVRESRLEEKVGGL